MNNKNSSIFVVEDSLADHFLIENMIKNHDPSINIIKAYDGEEALHSLDTMSETPSLILLDINMPRMNGFEFLEAYTNRQNHQENVAVLTSSSREEDKNRAFSYPCVVDFYNKPFKLDYILPLL